MAKIKDLLFKPDWEHKDPRVRVRATAESDDPRLLELLPRLAADDPDPGVRLQAARRLTDIHQIRDLAESADESEVRDYARQTFRKMLAGVHSQPVPLDARMRLLAAIEDPELIEYLAREGVEEALRGEALKRVSRPSLLGDIAVADSDPQIRRAAAQRIEQASTLERVAGKSRTLDKQVYRIVSERLVRMRLEAGDPTELGKQAADLCLAMEQLTTADRSLEDKRDELVRLDDKWAALGEPPPELAARFLGARRILQAAVSPGNDGASQQRAEINHYLADCVAHLKTADLDSLQRLIDRGIEMQRRLAGGYDAPEGLRLGAGIAELSERREQLVAEQAPAPELVRLCELAEKTDLKRAGDKQIASLKSSWERAWGSMSEHRAADQSLSNRFAAAIGHLQTELGQRRERRQQALERLDETLVTLEARLEAGDLAGSVKAKQLLLDDIALVGQDRRVAGADFKSRVNGARGRLYELRDWQHWANNKIRARLCEDAEAIPGSGMHPDAVAEKVKSLNAQWRELEESEHLPGDDPNRPANPGLRRRFQSACSRAFLPAKDYFKKRAEIRNKHLKELEELSAELEALVADSENQDLKHLERSVSRARRGLRSLGKIPPRERGPMSKRLREGANAIDARLSAHYEIVERKKKRIIEAVDSLAEEADLGKAVSAAKEAQRQWQQCGHCRRRQEQQLWSLFRAASDRVFARLDEQRAEHQAERQAQVEALEEVLAGARGLLATVADDPLAAQSQLRGIENQWRQLRCQHRRLESKFQGLVEEIRQACEQAEQRRIIDRRRAWRDLALACQAQEQRLMDGKKPQVAKLESLRQSAGPDAPEELLLRAGALVGAAPTVDPEDAATHLQEALELCLRMEFLAGVETPKEFREQRMNYQVKRLADRMSGGIMPSPQEEADHIERAWLGCGPLPSAEAETVNKRFLQALETFHGR